MYKHKNLEDLGTGDWYCLYICICRRHGDRRFSRRGTYKICVCMSTYVDIHTYRDICLYLLVYTTHTCMYMEICVYRGIQYVWRHVYIEVYLNFVWSYMKDFPYFGRNHCNPVLGKSIFGYQIFNGFNDILKSNMDILKSRCVL